MVRKSRPAAVVGSAPTDWAPSASTGTPLCSLISASGSTAPVVQSTDEVAISRVRGVTAARIASGSGGTTTTVAADAPIGPSSPKCSSVVVTTSSPGARPKPAEHDRAALGRRARERDLLGLGADERCERLPSSSRSASVSSKYARPLRPRRTSRSTASRSSSTTGRASGPNVPALRYATVSSTGNSARASSKVTTSPSRRRLDDGVVGEHDAIVQPPVGRPRGHRTDRAPRTRTWSSPRRTTSSIVRPPRLRVPSSLCADARRPRRSSRLHAAVRPRAGVRAGASRRARSSSSRRRSASASGPRRTATRSSRASTRGRAASDRMPSGGVAKASSIPLGMRRLLARPTDVLHLQWLAAPELDVLLLRTREHPRVHGPRPRSAAHGPTHAPLAPPLRALRPDRRPLRARARGARARSASTPRSSASSPTPCSAATRRARTTAGPSSRPA